MGFIELDRFTQMVTKTEICSYTAHKIYPGRGRRFVAKDGKTSYFLSQKARSMFHQGIKKVYLGWTQEWRAKHKKIRTEEAQKRHTRKTTKVRKAIVGMSLDEIKRRRAETREDRDKVLLASEKEVKERQAKKIASKKAVKSVQKNIPSAGKAIKNPSGAKVSRGAKK